MHSLCRLNANGNGGGGERFYECNKQRKQPRIAKVNSLDDNSCRHADTSYASCRQAARTMRGALAAQEQASTSTRTSCHRRHKTRHEQTSPFHMHIGRSSALKVSLFTSLLNC
eukprot:scaffold1371_cov122-Isochrysis_galbana.AAC.7